MPHPLDVSYSQLKAELSHVKKSDQEYKVIEKYLEATAPQWRKLSIVDVWRVDREGEDERFRKHEGLANRKLLWHGTNVAVVAAILKSGLRIMPHSGGRVGKGIYFASENSKSAGYGENLRSFYSMLHNNIEGAMKLKFGPFQNFDFTRIQQTRIPPERASQKEQNGANFSFIAPSTVE